jgi:hypothetical protein
VLLLPVIMEVIFSGLDEQAYEYLAARGTG